MKAYRLVEYDAKSIADAWRQLKLDVHSACNELQAEFRRKAKEIKEISGQTIRTAELRKDGVVLELHNETISWSLAVGGFYQAVGSHGPLEDHWGCGISAAKRALEIVSGWTAKDIDIAIEEALK